MEWHQTKSDDKEKDDVESAISKHQDNTGPPKNPTNVWIVIQLSTHFSLVHMRHMKTCSLLRSYFKYTLANNTLR